MLIHRQSRRAVLRAALGAGAAIALPGCMRSLQGSRGSKSREQVLWAFVSDTHIDTDRDCVEHDGKMSEHFELVLADVLATKEPLAGILVNGDMAHLKGRAEDYVALVKLLEPIRRANLDLSFVPGNHDDRTALLTALRGTSVLQSPVPDHCVSIRDSGPLRFILLDSLIRTDYTPGELGKAQLEWLAGELDKAPDRPTILFMHHCIRGDGKGLIDEKALTDVIVPRRQVKALIMGHSHEYRSSELEGIQLVELPASGYAFTKEQPVGWIRARLDGRGAELELRALDVKGQLHSQKRLLRWRQPTA